MAVGKNHNASWNLARTDRKGKRDALKKFKGLSKKDWLTVKTPRYFKNTYIGKTPITRGHGSDKKLIRRVFEVNLADLEDREDLSGKIFKFEISDVRNNVALTTFKGMRFTNDRYASLIRRRTTLIEGNITVKTADGFSLRVFVVAIPRWRKSKQNCYSKTATIKKIRKKMLEIVKENVINSTIDKLVTKLIPYPDLISTEIVSSMQSILPLTVTHITKIKIVKAPPLSVTDLLSAHRDNDNEDLGKPVAFKDVILQSV